MANTEFDIVDLDDCIRVVVQYPFITGVSNFTLVERSDDLTMIDCPLTPTMAHAACDALDIAPTDVTSLLLTHAHIDHVGSAALFESAKVWATRNNVCLIEDLQGLLSECGQWMPKWKDELESMLIRTPTDTFEDSSCAILDGLGVTRNSHGRAHSECDSSFLIPDSGVLVAGDLAFFHVTPLLLPGGSLRGWIHALETIQTLDFAAVVPGHGPIGDVDSIRRILTDLYCLSDHVERSVARGYSLAEARHRFKAPATCDTYAETQRWDINVFTAFCEFRGVPFPESPKDMQAILEKLGEYLNHEGRGGSPG